MAESLAHSDFVIAIVKWIEINCHKNDYAFIKYDHPKNVSNDRPPNICGFVPDVYVDFERIIIGEAKTLNDFERPHSIEQYLSYLNFINNKKDALIIFAAPFIVVPRFRTVIDDLIYKYKINLDNKPIYIQNLVEIK
jgi:hypothetical protein